MQIDGIRSKTPLVFQRCIPANRTVRTCAYNTGFLKLVLRSENWEGARKKKKLSQLQFLDDNDFKKSDCYKKNVNTIVIATKKTVV